MTNEGTYVYITDNGYMAVDFSMELEETISYQELPTSDKTYWDNIGDETMYLYDYRSETYLPLCEIMRINEHCDKLDNMYGWDGYFNDSAWSSTLVSIRDDDMFMLGFERPATKNDKLKAGMK